MRKGSFSGDDFLQQGLCLIFFGGVRLGGQRHGQVVGDDRVFLGFCPGLAQGGFGFGFFVPQMLDPAEGVQNGGIVCGGGFGGKFFRFLEPVRRGAVLAQQIGQVV